MVQNFMWGFIIGSLILRWPEMIPVYLGFGLFMYMAYKKAKRGLQ